MPPLYLRIKHLGATHDFVLAEGAAATTLGDLKNAIYDKLKVPPSKQRLLITRGGGKLPTLDSAVLSQHLPPDRLSHVPLAADAAPVFMLIGNPEIPVTAVEVISGESATPSSSHIASESDLVCVPRERPEGLYACSYSAGHVSQEAYYCRTCADAGFADPQHFFCFGCAEVCHAGHETEHWGLHTFLRCDCCTSTCCRPTSQQTTTASSQKQVPTTPTQPEGVEAELECGVVQPRRCHFVVNSTTENIPNTPLPPNPLNRYATETKTWCFCKGNDALPEDNEDALNCLLCHNCFYFSHMTRLHTDMFLTVPCYAETSGFNTLGYRCNTCGGDDVFCPPCIVHCHQGHEIDEEPVVFEHQSHHPNQRELKCACGSGAKGGGSASGDASVVSCPISHDVQETRLMDLGARPGLVAGVSNGLVPQWMARQLVGDDELCAFVCASCMITHPWLWNTDAQFGSTADHAAASAVGSQDLTALRRCWKGQLPTAPRPSSSSSIVSCRRKSASNLSTPLIASPQLSAFSSNATSALEFTPAAPFPYHGMLIAEEFFRFLCQCSDCQAAFAKISPRNQGAASHQHLFISYEESCAMCNEVIENGNGYLCVTCELAGVTCLLCATCATSSEAHDRHSRESSTVGQGVHHEFVRDTLENLWGVFGAQLMRDGVVDREAKEWMLENWNQGTTRELVLDLLRESAFGARAVVVAPTEEPTTGGAPSGAGTTNTDTTEGGDDKVSSKKRPRDNDDDDRRN